MLIASLIGPVTRHIGLVPTAIPTHTEPFHLASAFSTLDYVSNGRAGWRPQVSGRPSEAAHVGFRTFSAFDPTRLDDPDVDRRVRRPVRRSRPTRSRSSRRLWDSWEDDAIIKDKPTGRYIDRDKLHYVDFEGRFFSVKGPSIVPRPPQGQPVVAALAHSTIPFEFAARSADVVFITPPDTAGVDRWIDDVRTAERAVDAAGRAAQGVRRPGRVPRRRPRRPPNDARSISTSSTGTRTGRTRPIFVGTPGELVDRLLEWQTHGLDGFRLRPGVIGHDLDAIVDGVVPELQRPRRLPHRVRGRPVPRTTRAAQTDQPLRRRGPDSDPGLDR